MKKKRILFVDDEPKFLNGIRRMLESQEEQWDTSFAHNVDEALYKINQDTPDAIFSDVFMPGKSGFVLLEILRESEKTRDIPVVVLTGGHENDLKRRALKLGATDLLNKPIIPEDLLARINSVLSLKSYQDELKEQNEILDRKVQERTAELKKSRLDIILRLGKAAEYRDDESGKHILRVGCYCRVIANELKMDQEFVEMIFLASPLHDIGKIVISDQILMKPGKLTPAERKIMEQHCDIGAQILQQDPESMESFLKWGEDQSILQSIENPILEMASTIALSHHEKWDGSGYPQGHKGHDIPLAARIAALADVYDALRSNRPYKPAYSDMKTMTIMLEEEKTHFDPMVIAAFKKVNEIFSSIHDQFSSEIIDPVMLETR
ncbi:HD domain-containing phosphohydrolase [Planctomycetota bacterium]